MSPLDQVRIATPCPMSWDAMKGDDRRRFCDACKLHVYDLSNMREQEALDLIARSEGRLCVRLWRRKDGTVITADCPIAVADRARRRVRKLALALTGLMLAIMGGIAFAGSDTGKRIIAKISAMFTIREDRPAGGIGPPPPPPPPPK